MSGSRVRIGLDETPDQIAARVSKLIADNFELQSAAETLSGSCPYCPNSPKCEHARVSPEDGEAWLATLSEDERIQLEYSWEFWARPKQRTPPGDWKRWINVCGRGWGKSRCGSEFVRHKIESGECRHMALVAANAKDLRRVIVEDIRGGGSGLLQICPPWNYPEYSPTKMRLTWTNPNYRSYGASCSLYSAEEPGALRGPAHDGAWMDEFAKFERAQECWDMLQFGLRIGQHPQVMITTTPKPTPAFMSLIKMPGTVVTTGSTFENQSNLSTSFLQDILQEYEGTRLGKQELYADLLIDIEGALWTMKLIEQAHLPKDAELPILRTRVVGVDPQMSFTPGALTGIVVCGMASALRGNPVRGYVLADRSMSGTPKEWAKALCDAYWDYECQLVLAERNQGGELVADNIHNVDPNVRVKLITSTKSKGDRAIPVVSRYEQERVRHVGSFPQLEQEMLTFVPGDERRKRSPNRVDALIFALDYLLVGGLKAGAGFSINRII